ncbi:MAG: chaperonin GroEL [Planctomycetes bacterium]|nr:chaperonin GroEL [Planctomycetota bacterium]
MPKQLCFDVEARNYLRAGVEKAARAVSCTLGPRGRSVIIDRGWGGPNITKDGASVADEITLKHAYENLGAQMLKETASKTSDAAGDGSTTSVTLAAAIYREGLKHLAAGADGMALARGVQKGAAAVGEALTKAARPIKGDAEIARLATIAAGNDASVGRTIADAVAKVGADGIANIEESKGIETEVKIVEGMQFDRGYLSPHFATNAEELKVILEQPYILIHEDKISSVAKLIPLLEKFAAEKKPLLIIAEDVEGDALAALVVNKLRGILQCAAVKAPGYGDRRKAMLEDIAVLTGGEALTKDIGFDLEKVELSKLGRAKKVIIDSENTTIVEGAGSKKKVDERVALIRREHEASDSDYDREKLLERIAKLSGGIGQIHVGAATETELKAKKSRFEDALHATKAAIAEGIVAGGGVALLRSSAAIDRVKTTGDEEFGVAALRSACSAPLKQIAENAGQDGGIVLRRVLARSDDYGYDAEAGEYGDLISKGVIDPVKVTRTALQNAASVAAMLLTTNVLVTDLKEDKEEEGAEGDEGGEEGMEEDFEE